MDRIIINIAHEYTRTPGPRYEKEGKFSGEVFRKNYFVPKIKKAIEEDKMIEVNLDGTSGYGTSFIEEIFGGLIREDKINYTELKRRLHIVSKEEEYLIDDIEQDMLDAKNEVEYDQG
ncbi:MAG TPA: STAS-like domain-containing protein [Flavobacterium sp.]|jgi:hypothetical protein